MQVRQAKIAISAKYLTLSRPVYAWSQSGATDRGELMALDAGKRRSLLMAGDDEKVYDKKPQRYAEDNGAAFRSGKSEAKITTINDRARGSTLLKLRHKASRGLSATAELLVHVEI